jgi:octaprenyl-diphosphate synthase
LSALSQTEDNVLYSPSIDDLQSLLASEMMEVNQLIVEKMQSSVTLIPELARHLVMAGGKRLRPLLTLASAKLCGYEDSNHTLLATAIEFIHTATLLHDDVVDESDKRRGLDAANEIWGNQASVLVGDFLFSRSFELMVESGCLETLGILSHASATIAEGEVAQLMTAGNLATTEQDYLEVIDAKTAALFAAAARMGPILSGHSNCDKDRLDRFGRDLGIIFQLVDDILDYVSDDAKIGKNTGDDFRDGKITLPVIHAYHKGNQEEKIFWHRIFEDMDQKDGDFDKAVMLINKHNAIKYTYDFAKQYAAKAHESLGYFPESPIRTALHQLVEFSLYRHH